MIRSFMIVPSLPTIRVPAFGSNRPASYWEPVGDITPTQTRSGKPMTRKQAIAALKKLRAEVPTLTQDQIRALKT